MDPTTLVQGILIDEAIKRAVNSPTMDKVCRKRSSELEYMDNNEMIEKSRPPKRYKRPGTKRFEFRKAIDTPAAVMPSDNPDPMPVSNGPTFEPPLQMPVLQRGVTTLPKHRRYYPVSPSGASSSLALRQNPSVMLVRTSARGVFPAQLIQPSWFASSSTPVKNIPLKEKLPPLKIPGGVRSSQNTQTTRVQPLVEFNRFADLPVELQNSIWDYASMEPRKIRLDYTPAKRKIQRKSEFKNQSRNPTVLSVCKASRERALKFYTKVPERIVENSMMKFKTNIGSDSGVEEIQGRFTKHRLLYVNFGADTFVFTPDIDNLENFVPENSYNFAEEVLEKVRALEVEMQGATFIQGPRSHPFTHVLKLLGRRVVMCFQHESPPKRLENLQVVRMIHQKWSGNACVENLAGHLSIRHNKELFEDWVKNGNKTMVEEGRPE